MSRPLHLLPEQAFRCHGCGRCCRHAWTIPVEPAAAQSIEASAVASQLRKQGFEPLPLHPGEGRVVGRQADGRCLFLQDDQRCSVHRELGSSHKPLACQLFPYALTETPDGVFASLSYACPSVVRGLAGDWQQNVAELSGLLAQTAGSGPRPEEIAVRAGQTLPWSGYLQLEAHLLDVLQADDPVSALLEGALQVIAWGPHPERWPAVWRGRDEDWEQALFGLVGASVVALWELPQDPEQRTPWSQALLQGEEMRSPRFGHLLPPWESWLSPPSASQAATLRRYLRNAVWGKTLLAGPLVQRLLTLVCGARLILYYSRAFLGSEQGQEAADESLCRAFELVESELVTHTHSLDPLLALLEEALAQTYGAPQ